LILRLSIDRQIHAVEAANQIPDPLPSFNRSGATWFIAADRNGREKSKKFIRSRENSILDSIISTKETGNLQSPYPH